MAIHFNCSKCGKKLFAQDEFAAREVVCPQCQSQNIIPAAGALVDMEQGAVDSGAPVAPVAPVAAVPPLSSQERGPGGEVTPATALPPASPPPSPAEDATKLCPLCGERIKAVAIKCRYCGSMLNGETSAASEPTREQAYRAAMERSVRLWRMLARIAIGITIGWLLYVMLIIVGQEDRSIPALVFDMLLIGGMFVSMRQMKDGPYQVFLVAALAVTLAMPILSQLSFQPFDAEVYRHLSKQFEAMAKEDPNFHLPTQAQWNQMFWSFTAIAGLFFAIPLWIASAKVAALQRLQSARK